MAFGLEILQHTNHNVDKFNEIYELDRFKARIFGIDNKVTEKIIRYNNEASGKFQIFSNVRSYGVTKTLKKYVSNKVEEKIIVGGGKFYRHEKRMIRPLMLAHIYDRYLEIFIQHFSWVRFLSEYNLKEIPFNTIIMRKLYSRDKVLKYMYGCNPDDSVAIKRVFEYNVWKRLRKQISNLENFNQDLLEDGQLFTDTITLAYKMNETVNAAWSVRRLKEQHDKWSKEFTDIAFELTNRPLNIHPIFHKLNEELGGILLTDTKQLAIEGQTQRHCVASYGNRVDSGSVAIFQIDGYTAEIINTGVRLKLGQYNGYRNTPAPNDLKDKLRNKIESFNCTRPDKEFNITIGKQSFIKPLEVYTDIDLPF